MFENCKTDINALEKHTLDLINRQQAEIERLKPFEKKVLEPVIKKFQKRDCPFSPFDEYCTGHCVNCENRLECVDCSKHLKTKTYKEFAEMIKEKLKPTLTALFCIGEILVDVSKSHISPDRAIEKIREQLTKYGVVHSRFRFEEMIDDTYKELTEDNK
jgi:hypothetical protein